MAYDDALFQLGMDLTRSSTAQKEDFGDCARVAYPASSSVTDERNGARCAGYHVIIDLYEARRLDDVGHVERTLARCADVAGETLLHVHMQRSAHNDGVAGFAVFKQSHITVQTRPDLGCAALDIFVSGDSRLGTCIDVLKRAFESREAVVKRHARGADTPAATLPTPTPTPAKALRNVVDHRRTRVKRAA